MLLVYLYHPKLPPRDTSQRSFTKLQYVYTLRAYTLLILVINKKIFKVNKDLSFLPYQLV